MKKIFIVFFLFVGSLFTLTSFNVRANEESEFIELYPYDDVRALDVNSNFTAGSKVGTSNWTYTYAGHRYHSVRDAVRYAKDFNDNDNDGYISTAELGSALAWNAFGQIIMNDTDESFIIKTTNNRTDTTTVVHRMYAYFDEDGYLFGFEDHILTYPIINEGTETISGQAWRLATEAEVTANDPRIFESPIRLFLDDSAQGYTLEPLKSLTWDHLWAGLDKDGAHPRSIIFDENPDFIRVEANSTVVSFGTIDRDGTNKKTLAFIKSLPGLLVAGNEKMELQYEEQAPSFGNTLAHLDKDPATKGINFVIEYKGEFATSSLVDGVKATYRKMYDENGKLLNEVKEVDYQILINKNEQLVETINVTWDGTKYVADKEIESIDSNNFGDAFDVVYKAVSPVDANLVAEPSVDVLIGVFPPKFENLPKNTIFANEGEYVDLLGNIKANNGYDVDITDLIEITTPRGFSQYSPKPGTYTIDLKFLYNVYIAGDNPEITFTFADNTKQTVGYDGYDKAHGNANAADVHLYTKQGYETIVKEWAAMAWTSELLVVENGKIVKAYSRANNKVMDEANPLATNNAGNTNVKDAQWFKSLVLEENQIAIVVRGTSGIAVNGWAKGAYFNQPLAIQLETEAIDHDFEVTASYTLQIDDKTAPVLIAKENEKSIYGSDFTSVDAAILSNVIAMDNFSNVTLVVSNKGGLDLETPGTYTVTVQGFDAAGNQSTISFKVVVLEKDTVVEDLENNLGEANNSIKDLENDLKDANNTIKDLEGQIKDIKPGTPMVLTIVISLVFSGLSFGAAFVLGRKKQ